MFIKRNGEKNDCVVAGMVINDMRTKEFEDKVFYEIPVSMGQGCRDYQCNRME